MRAPIFQIDAFTTRRFAGNPAAVVLLERFPDDDLLQKIAAENNLAETAFLVAQDGDYRLRWFTPAVEVSLCGHATLASAAAVMERLEPSRDRVVFHSASGPLTVTRSGAGYTMDFPARPSRPAPATPELIAALGVVPADVAVHEFDVLARLDTAAQVRALMPDLAAIARMPKQGLIVTAEGDAGYDFVSRYFAPAVGIPEDPVTGSAHCTLAPYWQARTGRTDFHAFQASARGGDVICRVRGDRVQLQGMCAFYLEGIIEL